MNNVTKLLPPGTTPQPHVQWPNFARNSLLVRTVGVSDYDSLQMRFQRRYHKGLQFLMSYTLSEATTNAGDSLSGGGVGGLRAPDVVGLGPARTISASRDSTRSTRSCSAEATIFPAAERFLADGGPIGCCRCTADKPRRSTAPWRQVRAPAVTRCSSAIRTKAPARSTSSTIRRPLPIRLRSPPSDRQDFSPLGGNRSQVIGPGMRQLDMGFSKQIEVGARGAGSSSVAEAFNVTNTPAFTSAGRR